MSKHLLLLAALVSGLVLAGCTSTEEEPVADTTPETTSTEEVSEDAPLADQMESNMVKDDQMMEVDEVMVGALREPDYQFKGTLEAVTDDAAVGTETGISWAAYDEEKGVYTLYATFAGLPELDADEYFYEGWIVRKGADFSVISTGPVEYDAKLAQWVNKYQSEQDLTDHLQYVLTLEPNDNDPAPAAHVLDGVMEPLEMN